MAKYLNFTEMGGIDDKGGGLWVNQSQKFLEHYSVCGELTLGEFLQVYTKEELIVADCFTENQILINVKLAFLDSVHYPKLGKLKMLQVYAKLGLIRKKFVESSFIGVKIIVRRYWSER